MARGVWRDGALTDVRDIARLLRPPDARLWIDLVSPSEDEIRIVADALGLHPLIAEDIAERNQRSKVETFDQDVVHVVLFALHYQGEATASEIDFVLGKRYLLSVHDGALGAPTSAPLRFGVEHALEKGPDYLLYALSDTIVDGYFPVLDRIGDDIDDLQDRVMQTAVHVGASNALLGSRPFVGRPRRRARSSPSSRTARCRRSIPTTSSTTAMSTTT